MIARYRYTVWVDVPTDAKTGLVDYTQVETTAMLQRALRRLELDSQVEYQDFEAVEE